VLTASAGAKKEKSADAITATKAAAAETKAAKAVLTASAGAKKEKSADAITATKAAAVITTECMIRTYGSIR